jgi:O-antigen/teichoic acid export membrane protein
MTRDITGTITAQVFQIAIAAVGSIITARILQPTGKADYAMFTFGVALFVASTNFGMPSSVVYFRSRNEITHLKVIELCMLQCSLGIIAWLVLLLVGSTIEDYIMPNVNTFYVIAFPFAILLSGVNQYINALMVAARRFFIINVTGLIGSAATLLIAFIIFAASKNINRNIYFYLFGTIGISALIAAGQLLFYVRLDHKLPAGTVGQVRWRSIYNYGLMSYAADFLQLLSYRVDIWFVLHYLGKNLLGQYVLGVGLAQFFWLVPGAIASVVFPNAAAFKDEQNERIAKLGRLSLFIGILGAVIAVPIAPSIVPLLYGAPFQRSATVFAILLIGVVPFSLSIIYAALLAGHGHIKINLFASGIGCACTLLLNPLMIPLMGIIGASLVSAIAYLMTTVVVVFGARQMTGLGFSQMLFIRKVDVLDLRKEFVRGVQKFRLG